MERQQITIDHHFPRIFDVICENWMEEACKVHVWKQSIDLIWYGSELKIRALNIEALKCVMMVFCGLHSSGVNWKENSPIMLETNRRTLLRHLIKRQKLACTARQCSQFNFSSLMEFSTSSREARSSFFSFLLSMVPFPCEARTTPLMWYWTI